MKIHLNRKNILALIGVFVLCLAALSAFTNNTGVLAGEPKISEEEAIAIAEDHTGGTAISVELEKEDETQVYEVIVENEIGRYEVEIDADDGTILEVEEDDDNEDDDDDDQNEHEFEGEEEGDN